MPNTPTGNETAPQGGGKFVERFEMAIMQYAILQKASQGEVTKENLQQIFRGGLQMKSNHFDHCISELQRENHIKVDGNKIRATDDGREDVQEVQRLVMEAGTLSQGSGTQQQRPSQPQSAAAGGGSSTTQGGSSGQNRSGGPGTQR